jgi:hypothetical protein
MTRLQLEHVYPTRFIFHFNFLDYITRCIENVEKTKKTLSCKWDELIKSLTLKVEPKMK